MFLRRIPDRIKLILSLSLIPLGLFVSLAQSRRAAPSAPLTPVAASTPNRPRAGGAYFRDVAEQAGIGFRLRFDAKGDMDILKSIGRGCAFLDYDNDGNLDILLIGPKLALYKGDGHGHFKDVTHQTHLDTVHGDFVGCAVGDFNNDGYDDIYLSAYRGGVMLYNRNGRYFEDVTRQLGIKPQPFGNSCAVADFDGDGRLDLYITNYVAYDHARFLNKTGMYNATRKRPLWPDELPTLTGVVYKNCGDHFEDATRAWGAAAPVVHGKAMAADVADIDGSARPALFIGNDSGKPQDLLQFAHGRFRNIASVAGIAFNSEGRPYSGMGIDFGDYDNDGKLDAFVTTWNLDDKRLFHNTGAGTFVESSGQTSLHDATFKNIAWGAKFFDYDNDGWLDLVIANGHTSSKPPDFHPGQDHFKQATQVFHNLNGAVFDDVTATSGPDLNRPILGRGLAIGDFDNDGRMDVLVVDADGRPQLLHNETPNVGHWLLCRLIGTKSNRDGIGAMLTFETPDGRKMLRRCTTDGSYLSASDKRVHCGLDRATSATITVKWPSGHVDVIRNVAADRVVTLKEGASQAQFSSR